MYSAWSKHLRDPEEKVQFENSIKHSKWILDHLKILLEEMEEDLNKADTSPRTYEVPNWAYRQAHNNGARQYIRTIKKLISVDQKDKLTTDDRSI